MKRCGLRWRNANGPRSSSVKPTNGAIGTLAGGIAHDFKQHPRIGHRVHGDGGGRYSGPSGNCKKPPECFSNRQHGRGDLVKQILAFSRKTEHVRGPMSLDPLIKETIQLLRASIPSTIEIKFSMQATSDVVLCIAHRDTAGSYELAGNAAIAMQEKGGSLKYQSQ